MNKAPALNLVDIKEPPLAEQFYLTPMHFLCIGLLLALLIWVVTQWYRHWLKNAPRRAALKELEAMPSPSAAQINLLLKRFIRSYNPNHPALSYSGQPWQDFLCGLQKKQPVELPNLNELLYQQQADPQQVDAFKTFAINWLKAIKLGALDV